MVPEPGFEPGPAKAERILSPLASTQSNEVISRRRRRDTLPAAFHYLSTTGEDSWGLQGTHGDNELACNSLPLFDLVAKVAHRRCFSKTRDAGSIPAASTM